MFIGGLNWETTDQSLKEYFSKFGEVVECTVMRDGASGRSRGFGFLTFKDARTVNVVMVSSIMVNRVMKYWVLSSLLFLHGRSLLWLHRHFVATIYRRSFLSKRYLTFIFLGQGALLGRQDH